MSCSFIWISLAIYSLSIYQKVQGAKILAIPYPMHSHVAELNAVAVELVKRGYQVTFYLPDDLDVKKSAPDIPNIRFGRSVMSKSTARIEKITKLSSQGKLTRLNFIRGSSKEGCTQLSNDTEGLKKLRREKFDFAIIDYKFYLKCYLLVAYNLSIPFAGISTSISLLDAGQPIATSVTPFFMTSYPPNMAFHERVINTIIHVMTTIATSYILESYDYSKIAPELSWQELHELSKRAEIYLSNSDILLSYPTPSMPNIIEVGGLTVKPSKPLPKYIQKFFDEAKHGVIIVSFGSRYKCNYHTKNIFMSVFKNLNQRIFWKADEEKEIGNVLMTKWLPQNDALAHPNTKLIIYHCGNNGMFESLYHGVPLVCLPQAGDQFMNSRKLGYLKIGRFLDISDLTKELLQEYILDVITDPKYTANIKRLSEIYRSRPETAPERAASAIEHVIKYGGKHLRLDQVDLSTFQLLAVDVWFSIFILLIFFIKIVLHILCVCKRFVQSKKKVKQN